MFEYMNMTCTFSVISSYIKCQNEFDPLIKIGFVRQIVTIGDYDEVVNKHQLELMIMHFKWLKILIGKQYNIAI